MKVQLLLVPAAIIITTSSFSPTVAVSTEKKEIMKFRTLDNSFAFFRTHKQGKKVTATWALSSTAGVAGFVVQRTDQDPTDPYAYWEDLCSMSCNPSRSFKYTDENVFPGYINYRVVAQMTDGSSITSEVSGVRIVSR